MTCVLLYNVALYFKGCLDKLYRKKENFSTASFGENSS